MSTLDRIAASMPWLRQTFLGNTWAAYLTCLVVVIVGVGLVWILSKSLSRGLKRLSRHTDSTFDDFVIGVGERFLPPAAYVLVICFGLRDLHLKPALAKALMTLATVTVAVQAVRFISAILQELLERHMAHRVGSEAVEAEKKSVRGILVLIRIVLWTLGGILVLDNLGVRVSTFVAGLGIGGIAIALAAQAVLGDLFSYFVIFFDRPFQVGHSIKIGNFQGEVESIGIKTTRLRSVSGEIVVMSNKYLTDGQVQNFRMLKRRRALLTFDVDSSTPTAQLRAIPDIVKSILAQLPKTTLDRAHLHSFQESGTRYEVVFFVEVPEYGAYMDVIQEFHLRLKDALESRGIGFAVPTRIIRALPPEASATAPQAGEAAAAEG
jgi:small-conductance mechanosensitive channel